MPTAVNYRLANFCSISGVCIFRARLSFGPVSLWRVFIDIFFGLVYSTNVSIFVVDRVEAEIFARAN